MSFLILGILLLLLSSGGLVLGLNYAFYMWEEKQIDTLAARDGEQVHSAEEEMTAELAQGKSKEGERTPLALPGKRVTAQIQKHMLTTADSEKFVGKMFAKSRQWFGQARTNSAGGLKTLFAYLVSLTKPLEEGQSLTHQEEDAATKTADPQAPVRNEATLETPGGPSSPAVVPHAGKEDEVFAGKQFKPAKIEKVSEAGVASQQKQLEEATLSMVSGADETGKSEEMGLFEKLENRILRRLQKSGMSDYDIWLELGDLYVKYNETKKAMEIYALVLKHSVNDIQKEKAMNKLIGL